MKILLTNDDSHSSPLLAFIIAKLKKFGDLTIVVPKHEQSWKGKSITRFGYLHLEEKEILGEKAYTVDGTPADCVTIAIHNLLEKSKPDLVVSGINAGLNAGLGFIWSSGTLGACFEANIAGVPAIAFSQHFDAVTSSTYISSYTIVEETLKKLKYQSDVILEKLLNLYLKQKPELLDEPITWNINFPFHMNERVQYVPCSSGQSFYGACYKRSPEDPKVSMPKGTVRFEHGLKDIRMDPSKTSDNGIILEGHVSITPIDIRTFAQINEIEYQKLAKIIK